MPKDEPYKYIAFVNLVSLFKRNGFSLYLVGGSVRDYLLKKNFTDMDVVTDATPEQMKSFLPLGDFTFAKYGVVKLRFDRVGFDIATLRKENNYSDYRHPGRIEFTKDLKVDVQRRDFTVNALYMDEKLNVFDYIGGQKDLKDKIIRVIGDPHKRLIEDPLRIIRAMRFSLDLGFKIEDSLLVAMNDNSLLLQKLNMEKIKEEIRKCEHQKELINYLNKAGIMC